MPAALTSMSKEQTSSRFALENRNLTKKQGNSRSKMGEIPPMRIRQWVKVHTQSSPVWHFQEVDFLTRALSSRVVTDYPE